MALYTDFKLKVQKARDMKMDTISSIVSEVEGYRKQLSKSYLEDKEINEKLVQETYENMQQDVDISHIFVSCAKDAPATDTLKAYNRALELLRMLNSGKSFGQVASDFSEDKSAKENKGELGFVTAMLPDGYYPMEKAIYAAKPGAVVGPVRSHTGYHLVKVNAFRKARGEIEAAQILIRKSTTGSDRSKQKVDSIYNLLQAGQKWDDVCAKYSDDKGTAAKGGYIGFFGINRYQRPFESAAFSLNKDNDYSRPVETSLGWHIIRRVSYRPIGTFESLKRTLTERVKRDSRGTIARESLIARIKKENGYVEYPKVLATWAAKQDTSFHGSRWKPNPAKPQDVLFKYNWSQIYTIADFEDYCASSSRDRIAGTGKPVQETIYKIYKDWNDKAALEIEDAQLPQKYPEFKSLLREYEEGILLFEVLKMKVWDKANTDTLSLERYYKTNLVGKYKWAERARLTIYTLSGDATSSLQKVSDFASTHNREEVLKKFKNLKGLQAEERFYEKGKNAEVDLIWRAGKVSNPKTDSGTGTATFMKIEEVVPPTDKTVTEARGYAVADYQDHLEKEWIAALRKEYKVTVDETVLKSLIRK